MGIGSPVSIHMLVRWCSMTSILTQTPASQSVWGCTPACPSGPALPAAAGRQDRMKAYIKAARYEKNSRHWSSVQQQIDIMLLLQRINVFFLKCALMPHSFTPAGIQFGCSLSSSLFRIDQQARQGRKKEKSRFFPVALLIWGELGNASRIKCVTPTAFSPHFLCFLSLSIQINKQGGGLGGARRRVEKEKKGVNCLPIDNSIITLWQMAGLRCKGRFRGGWGGGWSVGGDVKRDWPWSGTEIFAFVPTSLAAPGICDREFMSGLNVKLSLPRGHVSWWVGGAFTHLDKETLMLHKVVFASAYFTWYSFSGWLSHKIALSCSTRDNSNTGVKAYLR